MNNNDLFSHDLFSMIPTNSTQSNVPNYNFYNQYQINQPPLIFDEVEPFSFMNGMNNNMNQIDDPFGFDTFINNDNLFGSNFND